MKKIILVDLDGVLVDGPTEEQILSKKPKNFDGHWSDIPDIFLDLEPGQGAIEAFNKLSEHYDVYIVSTAPWDNPSAWTDKQKWVSKHLPRAHKKLFLTHNKHMVIGDYLIDDRRKNGAEKFPGLLLQFGQAPYENWDKILEYFKNN